MATILVRRSHPCTVFGQENNRQAPPEIICSDHFEKSSEHAIAHIAEQMLLSIVGAIEGKPSDLLGSGSTALLLFQQNKPCQGQNACDLAAPDNIVGFTRNSLREYRGPPIKTTAVMTKLSKFQRCNHTVARTIA